MHDSPRLRLLIVGVVALSLFAALLARLWYLQVLSAPQFVAQARQNQVRVVEVVAPRGRILDRNGVVLVDNRASNG
jgi:penicillin-binding protein 2